MSAPPAPGTTDWTFGAEHPEDLERGGGQRQRFNTQANGNTDIRSPMPVRPMEDSHGKLTVTNAGGSSTPPLTPPPFIGGGGQRGGQPGMTDWEWLTRSASPLVNGQSDRRPLTMGNPAVLGLWSFATVTLLLAAYNLFLPHKPNHILLPTALLFGGIAQYIAGFLDLFYGGTFSGTILVSYGAFWAGSGMMMLPSVSATLNAYATDWDVAQGNAIYHFFWAFYTLMLVGLSLKIRSGSFVLTWCLFWVFITLFLTAIYYITDTQAVLRVSGVSAFFAGLGAYYSGLAAILEEQKEKLWVGKYNWTKKST
ncbi:GPR1/FUN34/yaaH family-domain-containing protein [Zychaea mexicana]|uniref:GPR1/FUN34/yaaH family-domain-containing protein n=1 Tax=Zychaea mexicana TaxID=64656 RepID=UPI0022FE5582|nr:GPR1/FUN34/yaaH family-domain-containing protein [Zychaea mexicana]KAI9498010.1 GPR1/FUN34/yaaH family-domain-containing protein [Zychaea mexicana]